MIAIFVKFRVAAVPTALALALSALIMITPGAHTNALAQDAATASHIQAKIGQVGAGAIKLRESGGDVMPIQESMQQVDKLLRAGKIGDAEKILDTLLAKPGVPPAGPERATAAPPDGHVCDPRQPMTVNSSMTVVEDCTIGGDLTVTGNAVLRFDYTGGKGGRLVVGGNVTVRDHATLWIQGRADRRASFVIINEFSMQHSMKSTNDATIKLEQIAFRTQKSVDRGKGSVVMSYEARDRSALEVIGSTLVPEETWLLAELRDSARLSVTDSQNIPDEIYIRDSSSAKISGAATKTGVWLDAGAAKGTLRLPDVSAPFWWRIGAGEGLDVGWSLRVEGSQPGVGIEVRPTSALTIIGNGARAAATGELKISYFVVGARETLDGLKAGLQNRVISDRLTLRDVQLGPIAWQLYAGDHADLTVRNSTVNEIVLFGRDSKVRIEHSVLQLAALAAFGPDSALDIHDSDIWNQAIEAANHGKVSVTDSRIHGTLFHVRDSGSHISVAGGSFEENPGRCTQSTMVNIASGEPKCNPFRPPGPPRSEGENKVECARTEGCHPGQ